MQCGIQTYFETGILVLYSKLRSPIFKSVKANSSKNRQMTVHVLVPQCAHFVLSYSGAYRNKPSVLKISFNAGSPLGRAYSSPTPIPDSPVAQRICSSLRSSENCHPFLSPSKKKKKKKNYRMRHNSFISRARCFETSYTSRQLHVQS